MNERESDLRVGGCGLWKVAWILSDRKPLKNFNQEEEMIRFWFLEGHSG